MFERWVVSVHLPAGSSAAWPGTVVLEMQLGLRFVGLVS